MKDWKAAYCAINRIPAPPSPFDARPAGHHQRAGDLGPKQLAWCDQHIIGFKTMREQAQAAREHAALVLSRMGRGQ